MTLIQRSNTMGEIVAAFGPCHSPHLLTRPPDENPEHQELSIAAMRQLGKILDETHPTPPASAARLNRLLFDIRLNPELRERIIENLEAVCVEYGLTREQRKLAQGLIRVGTTDKVSAHVPPFV